jgi:hypothetical protein
MSLGTAGGAAGSIGGAALGSALLPGIGTYAGATLGGLAGSSLGNAVGGSSGAAGSGTSSTPSSSTAQVYQPQNQPAADTSYQTLLNQLYTAPNVAKDYLPTATGIAGYGFGSEQPGSYGIYGSGAVNTALAAQTDYNTLLNQGQTSTGYGTKAGGYLSDALAPTSRAAYSRTYDDVLQNVVDNPFYAQAQYGAQQGADIGQYTAGLTRDWTGKLGTSADALPGLAKSYADTTMSGVPTLQGLGSQAAGYAGDLYSGALGLRSGTQNLMGRTVDPLISSAGTYAGEFDQYAGRASSLADIASGKAPGYSAQLEQAYQPIGQGASAVLQTGFDPQSALYNRTYGQTLDQQRAINAMSGVGTSPYGAGVTSQAMSDFNLDWQDRQLQRQTDALASAGTATGLLPTMQAQSLAGLGAAGTQIAGAADITKTGADVYQTGLGKAGDLGLAGQTQQLADITGAGSAYSGLADTSVNAYGQVGTLANTAWGQQLDAARGQADIYGAGAKIGGYGADLATRAAAAPYNVYQTQQSNILDATKARTDAAATGATALGNLTSGLSTAGGMVTQGLKDYSYFGALPYDTAQTQQTNALQSIANLSDLSTASYTLPSTTLDYLNSYLGLGQTASKTSGYLGDLGSRQSTSSLYGLGSLGVQGYNALKNTDTSSGGLLGGLFGSGSDYSGTATNSGYAGLTNVELGDLGVPGYAAYGGFG